MQSTTLSAFLLLGGVLVAAMPASAGAQDTDLPDATPWDQGVEYRIEALLDESAQLLRGRARVRYRNDSPHTLDAFYLHLHLNAFRPNSLWARTDLEAGITTFQELGPTEHAFERLRGMQIDGERVEPFYPHAPDSTIVGVRLPEPLGPGEAMTVDYVWDARTSVVPRRQGRSGRSWDFAQWYPRVVVYDDEGWRAHPLYRQGEFYGEFATYDVTLDVAADQVIGATGVPVEGDPGWAAAAAPGTGEIVYQRDWYDAVSGSPAESLGHLAGAPTAGRKRVRWRAEDVHHFAWSTSPDYVYEQGMWEDVAIHVLYRPGDEERWGGGVAVERTAVALQWTDSLFGDYPYPQVTNIHRIEGGGTEFPMVLMDGSASQGLILHEVGHLYAHGILANNEWYEGWLDEGLSSFQTDWFRERSGAGRTVWYGDQRELLRLQLLGLEEPVVQPAEDFTSYAIYADMIYGKGSLLFYMLRELAGEEAFREILRRYYERYRFQHVDSETFEATAESVLGTDLDWFFDQWLQGGGVVDYALTDVELQSDARSYLTTVRVEREGDLVMPVPLRLYGAGGETRDVWLAGTDPSEVLTVRTDFDPVRVELDADGSILDWDVSDNHWPGGLSGAAYDWSVGNPFTPVASSWRTVPVELFPLAWVNDPGGVVLGLQLRSERLGLGDRWTMRLGAPGIGGDDDLEDPGVDDGEDGSDATDATDVGSLHLVFADPIRGGRVRSGFGLDLFAGEGRYRLAADVPGLGTIASGDLRFTARLFGTWEEAYVVPGRWTPGLDAAFEAGVAADGTAGDDWNVAVSGGVGVGTDDHVWIRGDVEMATERVTASGWRVGTRFFAGAAYAKNNSGDPRYPESWGSDWVPRERLFFLSGADPLETIGNPYVRSAGALVDLEGRMPGGGGLPGFHAGLGLPQILAVNLELAAPGLEVADLGGEQLRVRPMLFAGLAAGGDMTQAGAPLPVDAFTETMHAFYSAGAGLEFAFDGSPYSLRVDLPVLLSDPGGAAVDTTERFDLRWGITLTGR